jgi:lysophospholipase L1-like esterase
VPIRVENLGVSGYVNWQETQVFQDLLASGERPDVAVFLDGANDTSLGLERERFGLLDPSENHVQTMTDEQRDELASAAEQQGYRSSNDLDVAVELAAAQYRRGVELARELGSTHDVKVAHYWQPQLYTVPLDAPLVEDALEQWQITPERHEAVGEVVDRIADRSEVDPVDLTGIFDDVDGPIFYDTSHTNEEGARLTALAIMDDLWPTILAERSDA